MKSLKLLPLLGLSLAAHAGPEFSASVSGGAMVTDELEVIGPAWIVIPRFAWYANDTLGLEAGFGFQQGRTRIGGRDDAGTQYPDFAYTGLTPRLDLVGRLWTKGRLQDDGTEGKAPWIHPTLAVGLGAFAKNTADVDNALGDLYKRNDLDFMVNAGPGLMVPLGPLHLRTDLRWVLSLGSENFQNRGDQFINWEWTAGLGFNFGGEKDKDKDGIVDNVDVCPDVAEDFDEFEDDDGCPEDDNDKDGVLDAADACANEAEDKDEFEDADGCPDPDNDGDTILDADDACPLVAGHVSANGCPDQDGDGIVDEEDECADEPGPIESFGCADDDGDLVPNYRDECPDEPGPKAADPKRSDGCPSAVFITAKAITITDKIFFDTGKATIKPVSFPLLDTIAATLVKYQGIKKVSVEGHTDNVGKPEKNQVLSEDRAKSVVTYLVQKGVAVERLESKGFGQTKPLVEGDLANKEEGRSQNRRVEFNIVEQVQEQTVLKRPIIKLVPTEKPIEFDGLVATSTSLPEQGTVTEEVTCKANPTIGADGKVSKPKVTECTGIARQATGQAIRSWVFEPYQLKNAVIPVTTVFTVTYKDGLATVTHDKKSTKPVE